MEPRLKKQKTSSSSSSSSSRKGEKQREGRQRRRKEAKKEARQQQQQQQQQSKSRVGESGANNDGSSDDSAAKGRRYTVTLAIPGSIVENVATDEVRSQVAGQIARLAAVFSIDEIVVFEETDDAMFLARQQRAAEEAERDEGEHSSSFGQERKWGPGRAYSDGPGGAAGGSVPQGKGTEDEADATSGAPVRRGFRGAVFLARILHYLETPQYLRKALFPMHRDLKFAGMLHPLDTPHHMRRTEWVPFREGYVTLPRDQYQQYRADGGEGEKPKSNLVHVGLYDPVKVDRKLDTNVRVTVDMGETAPKPSDWAARKFKIVSPAEPRERCGLYWGYSVRMAASLRKVFTEAPHEKGYDLTIGTSERGHDAADVLARTQRRYANAGSAAIPAKGGDKFALPRFRHALIVIGGPPGIEAAVAGDSDLVESGVKAEDAGSLFDFWLNILPNQGSRTIRSEEAVAISLATLRPALLAAADNSPA